MFRCFPLSIVCAALLLCSTVPRINAEDRVSDFLKLPPVMAKQVGNPVVVVKPGKKASFRRKISSTENFVLRVPEARLSKGNIRLLLAEELLKSFYQKNLSKVSMSVNEKRLRMNEIIPMNQEIFLKVGMNRLLGKRAPSRMLDIWWKVRMGLPLKKSRTHQLLITNLHWEKDTEEKQNLGHFCFGVRKRGGDPDKDIMFDFRAPWPYDRRARFTEAVNIHNRLKLETQTYNLYDWFYTQTEHRSSFVNLWFVPIHEEQLALLRDFVVRGEYRNAGNFRVGKKNCASVGAHFLDRILPIGEEIEGRSKFVDYPVQTGQVVVRRFSSSNQFVRLTNITRKLRVPTAKSKLYPASPSRSASRPFRLLLKDPRIN